MPEPKKYSVFLSAAEPSADAYCAGLINAMKTSADNISFVGVGGPKMAQAGCDLLEITTGKAAMIYKAFAHVARFYSLIRRLRRYLDTNRVDLVIVCDSPAFNFHLAKAAKKAGIKTLFYVAPQLWAWAPWRLGKLRRCCDKLCCILPFEQQWFAARGIDTTFVGHPMLDDLPSDLGRCEKQYADFDPKHAQFALMPGSRAAEINSLWPPMQQIALQLKNKYPQAAFAAVAVDDEKRRMLESAQLPDFECEYTVDDVTAAAARADFAIVASGSATLQVASVGCPMLVIYQSSRILWHLVGRWLIRTEHLSLVNILAGRRLVPEFMPCFSSVEPIVKSIEQLIEDKSRLTKLSAELVQLTATLKTPSASENVARTARQMLASPAIAVGTSKNNGLLESFQK